MKADNKDNSGAQLWWIHDLCIDVESERVNRNGETLELPELSYRMLLRLVQAFPQPVPNDDLIRDVWQGVVVGPDTVKQRIKLLREALGDKTAPYRYVRTVRHGGYRLATLSRTAVPQSPWRAGRYGLRHVLVALLLIALAAWVAWQALPGPATTDRIRLALVPVQRTLGSEVEARYGDELVRGLADQLAAIEDVDVIAPRSVAAAAQHGAGDLARSLKVDVLVELAVEGPQDNPQLAVRLIDPVSETQLYSRIYQLPTTQELDRQRRIGQHAARMIHQMLAATLGNRVTDGGSDDSEAREQYRRGMAQFARSGAGNREQAERHFQTALQIDSRFALAAARLADLFADRALRGQSGNWAERAVSLSDQALGNRSDLPEALFAKAKALLAQGHNDEAFRMFDRVLVERPYLERSVVGLKSREKKGP